MTDYEVRNGKVPRRQQQTLSLLAAVFPALLWKRRFFVYWWFSQKNDSSDFFRHLPQREVSQVKALVLPEGSAGIWRLVSGTLSLAKIWSVSCPRGVHCRGAQKFLQSWLHLHRAVAAHWGLRAKPKRGGPFKHLRQPLAPVVHVASSCRLQKSAISHRELPPPALKPPNYVCAEGWQGRERGELALMPGCLHPPRWRVGAFLTRVCPIIHPALPPVPQPPGSDLFW